MTKHVGLWAMNVFNEWKPFHGFDTMKCITKDEGSIKYIKDMLSSFVLYVAKKNGRLHFPTKYNSLPFLESYYNCVFFSIMCFSSFYYVYAFISYMFYVLGLRFMLRF
jgi:hypothetical protein